MAKKSAGRLWLPVLIAGAFSLLIPCRELTADEFRRQVVVAQQGDASDAGRDEIGRAHV